MITVSGLSKRYGNRIAVDGLGFDVAAGRVTGFVGPNGAGKSTTMRMMVGLAKPDRGEVRYEGVAFSDLPRPPRTVGPSSMRAACTLGVPLAGTSKHLPQSADSRLAGSTPCSPIRADLGCRSTSGRFLARDAPTPSARGRPARRAKGAVARRTVQRPRP